MDTGAVESWQALGNEVVDGLAKSAAALYPVAPAFLRSLVDTEDKARLIRARLYAIHKWHLDNFDPHDPLDVEATALQSMARQISKLVAHERQGVVRQAEEPVLKVFRGHPSHDVVEYSGFFVCKYCGARARCERPVYKFLRSACKRQPSSQYFKRTLTLMEQGRSLT